MKITIESTTKLVTLNGVPARLWEGTTSSGIPVVAFVTRVAVPEGQPTEQFELELKEQKSPTPELAGAFDARLLSEADALEERHLSEPTNETLDSLMDVIEEAGKEAERAIERHGDFHSAHEAYGVLAEEVHEFWMEVLQKRHLRSPARMQAELIQIAAVAMKAATTLGRGIAKEPEHIGTAPKPAQAEPSSNCELVAAFYTARSYIPPDPRLDSVRAALSTAIANAKLPPKPAKSNAELAGEIAGRLLLGAKRLAIVTDEYRLCILMNGWGRDALECEVRRILDSASAPGQPTEPSEAGK
jgi:hypothetical protein